MKINFIKWILEKETEIYTSAKYLCTIMILMIPSPAAEATLFIAPDLTSTDAKNQEYLFPIIKDHFPVSIIFEFRI